MALFVVQHIVLPGKGHTAAWVRTNPGTLASMSHDVFTILFRSFQYFWRVTDCAGILIVNLRIVCNSFFF
jgi:hypothetical protein